MTKEIIKDSDFISIKIKKGNIEVSIKYPKRSSLQNRFKMLDKLKETLRSV